MDQLNVPGRHVALSADDSKLLATLKPYFDQETKEWYIVGGAGDPLLVSDVENLWEELEEADLEKATKIRVWVVQIPLPSIPPIVLAALPITEKVSAETLTMYTIKILEGLHAKDIWVVSYASDGTDKERVNQHTIRVQAHAMDTQTIHAPSLKVKDIEIKTAVYWNKPIALVQDSSHGRKTYRNNLYSRAKSMVLGNYCAQYKHIRKMALAPDSPLYVRDVEKTDRQDDRAAARVFSSAALSWLLNNCPSYTGTIVYLFVFGELIDAYQNRTITHRERLRMVLRVHYFIEIWKTFLGDTDYKIKMSYLSREVLNMSAFLTIGYLELLYIYRDSFKGVSVPLLPWLHSTEACEHVFAECRKQVKDFDYAAFLHLMPKMHWYVHHSMRLGNMSAKDAKARAGGYAHTCFGLEGLSVENLATFPDDREIVKIAKAAFDETESLWEQLNVVLDDLSSHAMESDTSAGILKTAQEYEESDEEDASTGDEEPPVEKTVTSMKSAGVPSGKSVGDPKILPLLSEWYPDLELAYRAAKETSFDDEIVSQPGIVESARAILDGLVVQDVEMDEIGPSRLHAIDNTMVNFTCAKLFLDFDTSLRLEDLEEPTTEQIKSFIAAYDHVVGRTLVNCLPEIVAYDQAMLVDSNISSLQLSRGEDLLKIRQDHETSFARKAVCTSSSLQDSVPHAKNESEQEDSKARFALIRKIGEVLKLQQDIGVGTGLGRQVRWTASDKTGNAANAVAAATTRATQTLSKRRKIFAKFKIPASLCQLLSSAGIHDRFPLSDGMFIIAFFRGHLLLAEVLSI